MKPGGAERNQAPARSITEALIQLASIATVAAGAGGSVALIATLDPRSGPTGIALQLGAAVLALFGCLLAMFELHRAGVERAARGRFVGLRGAHRRAGARTALAITALLFALTLTLTAAVEVVATQLVGATDVDASQGEEALRKAIERATAGVQQSDSGDSTGPRSGIVGPTGGSEEGDSRSAGAIGNLLSDEPILRVEYVSSRQSAGKGPVLQRTLHLRGFVIDSFDRKGVWRERGGEKSLVRDADDGRIDGRLDDPLDEQPTVANGRGTELELDVRFVGRSNGLVFAPLSMTSVGLETAQLEPRSVSLMSPGAGGYRVWSTLPDITLEELRLARSTGSRPAGDPALELPVAGGSRAERLALDSLTGYARTVVGDAASDADRVLDVVTHLRNEFGYEIYDVGFLSPTGCRALIDRGSGSCTHFASLAALLLRSLGLPTRIAAGYVAREPLEDAPGWLTRARDGHSWIEVHFEGYGWLPFDPTPGDPSVGGASRDWSPFTDGASVVAVNSHGAGTSAVGELVVDAVTWAFLAASRLLSSGAWALVLALLTIGVFAIRGHRRTQRVSDSSEERRETRGRTVARERIPAIAALLDALRRRGWVQGASATPMAFARKVENLDPSAGGLATAMRAAVERACTGRWHSAKDVDRVQQIAVTLRDADDLSRSESDTD